MPPPDDTLALQIARLYAQGYSLRRIAETFAISRRQVTNALHATGAAIAPQGRGRPRPTTRVAVPNGIAKTLHELYLDRRMTRTQVAEALGVPDHRVRAWLGECELPSRTRGAANREDRRRPGRQPLDLLYVDQQMPALAVGEKLDIGKCSVLGALHEQAVPVRLGGTSQRAITLLDALYDDDRVRRYLQKHRVPVVREAGPIHQRFAKTVALTKPMLSDLYLLCGCSTNQIELLTGQPGDTIRHALERLGIPRRPPGGLAPFTRRARLEHAQRG